MTTPFSHTQVKFIPRNGRRRSQSVTLPSKNAEYSLQPNIPRKLVVFELPKKQGNRDVKTGKSQQGLTEQTQDTDDDNESVDQKRAHTSFSTSTKKNVPSTARISPISIRGVSAIPSSNNDAHSDLQKYGHQSQLNRKLHDDENHGTKSQLNRKLHDDDENHGTKSQLNRKLRDDDENHGTKSQLNRKLHDDEHHGTKSQLNQKLHDDDENHGTKSQLNRKLHDDEHHGTKSRSNQKSQDDDQRHGHHSHNNPMLPSKSTMSLKELPSSASLRNLITDSYTASSSTNLIQKSELLNQQFRADNFRNQNGTKTGDQKKNVNARGVIVSSRSNASCMAAIIAIALGVISFAIALAALILVLLLRSTVNTLIASTTTSNSSTGGDGTLPSACSNYTNLTDTTRSVYATGYALGCDDSAPFINRTSPVWIRFTGAGGTTLPLTTPGMNLCGSEGTGWYDGTMPKITGQIINGTACFTWYNSVCRFSTSISVANCGSFYIYRLPPAPACMMRYCTI